MARDAHEKKASGGPGGKDTKPGGGGGAAHCASKGCKSDPSRMGFCAEHFDQFKFGLIRKTGEPVPDYDKKFDHYVAFKERRAGKKAA